MQVALEQQRLLVYEFDDQWDAIEISPLSDVHPGDPNFNPFAFDAWLKWLAEKPNRFTILNGDLVNAATRGSVSDIYTSTMSPREEAKFIIRKLEPYRDRILGATNGNHEYRIWRESGVSETEYIAEKLGVPYHPEALAIKITFPCAHRSGRDRICYLIYATHGWGGGRKKGGKLNKLDDLMAAVQGFDVYIMGHVHDLIATKTDYILPDPRNNKLLQVTAAGCIAGSFLRWGGYAQRYGYRPGTQEMPVIVLGGSKKGKDVRIVI